MASKICQDLADIVRHVIGGGAAAAAFGSGQAAAAAAAGGPARVIPGPDCLSG